MALIFDETDRDHYSEEHIKCQRDPQLLSRELSKQNVKEGPGCHRGHEVINSSNRPEAKLMAQGLILEPALQQLVLDHYENGVATENDISVP